MYERQAKDGTGMKVAIVGSSGYIAGYLIKAMKIEGEIDSIVKIDQSFDADLFLDLQQPEQFNYDALNGIEYIIFTAAISGPDKCADEFELCWQINVLGTKYFIKEAVSRGCNVLFFSSDAVFGNNTDEIYTEDSPTKANTPYGRMKKSIEDEFTGEKHFKAIRLSYVVSAKDKFVTYCISCLRKGEKAEIYHPFYRNCVTVSDVVKVVLWFIRHWKAYAPQILNVAGNELVSRIRIVDEMNRCLEEKVHYTVLQPSLSFFKNRPPITQMRSLYLEGLGILENESFTQKMRKEMENLNL